MTYVTGRGIFHFIILIHNTHIGSIYRESYICLMSIIHNMTGSDIEVVSGYHHSGCSECKWLGSIGTKKAAGALGFPVFGIFCHTVGFHRIIMIRVVLTSENIVIVIAFIECAENWQGQIQCHCSFEVIGCVVIFDQKLTIQGTGLYTHKVAVRACGEIGIDGCSPGFIVLRFQIASLVSIADCF